MWTIFKISVEFVATLLLFCVLGFVCFFFLAVRHVEFGLAPQPETEPAPPALASEVLTSGLNMEVPFLFCCLNFKILFVLN